MTLAQMLNRTPCTMGGAVTPKSAVGLSQATPMGPSATMSVTVDETVSKEGSKRVYAQTSAPVISPAVAPRALRRIDLLPGVFDDARAFANRLFGVEAAAVDFRGAHADGGSGCRACPGGVGAGR